MLRAKLHQLMRCCGVKSLLPVGSLFLIFYLYPIRWTLKAVCIWTVWSCLNYCLCWWLLKVADAAVCWRYGGKHRQYSPNEKPFGKHIHYIFFWQWVPFRWAFAVICMKVLNYVEIPDIWYRYLYTQASFLCPPTSVSYTSSTSVYRWWSEDQT